MTEKHIPLPWFVDEGYTDGVSIRGANGIFVADCYNCGHDVGQPTAEEGRANARLAVRAVNSHYEMLEALETAARFIKTARHYFPKSIKNSNRFDLENACASVNVAIAKAKGET